MVTAVVVVYKPIVLVGVVAALLALHRSMLVGEFQRAARIDAKPSLYTATFWHQLAEHELERARQRGSTVGVLMIDLDHFKNVNDTYGHPAGDQVLAAVAAEVKAQVRQLDTAARFGGEELVVVLPAISADALYTVAERIRSHIETVSIDATSPHGPTILHVTASVGGALFPDAGDSLDQVLLAADTALYAAKNAGRNRTELSTARAADI